MEQEPMKAFLEKVVELPRDTDHLFQQVYQFEEMMMMYNCAIREVKTKLEVLNDEFSMRNKRNPIEFLKARIKKPGSIVEKLKRNNLPLSLDSAMENLNDIAGIRVICSFIDDIYDVARMLTEQDDITLVATKDYIKHPKENGYRSLHLVIKVPVFLSDRKQSMRVEVQIRTIAMDFWASLEHQLKYKKDIENADEISSELKSCADIITRTDMKMQELQYRILKQKEITEV